MWGRRDLEKRARIVVDGVVKDVDTGGGWGVRGVIFFPLGRPFSLHFYGSPGVGGGVGRDGARGRSGGWVSAPPRVRTRKNAGIWAPPGAGTRKNAGIRRPLSGRSWPVRAPES